MGMLGRKNMGDCLVLLKFMLVFVVLNCGLG